MSIYEETRVLKKRLGACWNVFFGGFGRLTPVQADALPLLLDGKDALLASPTASGKSEAVLAPIVRHLLDEGVDAEGPGVLYIAPTRALIADLERRFRDLLKQFELSAAFRTSDSPHLPRPFPRLLFTTPESFDSLLCRKRQIWPNVRTLVLDELHLLDNTYRGDQLRVLVARLIQRLQGTGLHKVILSATVPDPQALAERYVGPVTVVATGEQRRLLFESVGDLGTALDLCRSARRHKLIAFCNSRRDCEQLAADAVAQRLWPRSNVFVHHASLSARERRETEAALREARGALCFATMTLELGIDIGDVSGIVLCGPPPDAEAFVQRLGRGCRRESEIFAVGIAQSDEEKESFARYEMMMRNTFLKAEPYEPDLSVVVQQLFSMLFAARAGVKTERLREPLLALATPDQFDEIVDHLVAEELIVRRSGLLAAGEKVMDMGEKGHLHTNIMVRRPVEVYDEGTGRVLGEVGFAGDGSGEIALGGRAWRVTGRQKGRLIVRATGGAAGPGLFASRISRGRFFSYLPPLLREPPMQRKEEA